ncbi:hypothetical protein D3C72_1648550 [compost metagenome]
MRIVFQPSFGIADTDAIQALDDLAACDVAPHAAMQRQYFGQLFFNGVQRIERHHRLLEYHRNLVAAHLA